MNPVPMKNFTEVEFYTSDSTIQAIDTFLQSVEIEIVNDSAGFVSKRLGKNMVV